jgi:hypothetical protein
MIQGELDRVSLRPTPVQHVTTAARGFSGDRTHKPLATRGQAWRAAEAAPAIHAAGGGRSPVAPLCDAQGEVHAVGVTR